MPPTRESAVMEIEVLAHLGKVLGADRLSSQVAKAVSYASKKFQIDPKSMQPFEKRALSLATKFSNIIGQTRGLGMIKEAEKFEAKMEATRERLLKDTVQAARIQHDLSQATSKEEKKRLREQLKDIRSSIKRREDILDKETKALKNEMEQRKEVLEEWEKFLSKSKGQKVEAGAEIAEGFADGIANLDASSLKGFGSKLLQGIGKGAKAGEGIFAKKAAAGGAGAGQAAKIAGMLGKLGAFAAAAAAVVAAIAAIVAIFVAADSKAKKMNKTLMETAGIGDLAAQTTDGLVTTLDAARETAIKVGWEFRQNTEDILQIIASANEAGFTFKEMKERLSEAGDEQEAFTNLTRTAVIASKTLGVSTKEVAETMAGWSHDFGGGLTTIQEGFAAISSAATLSGIGTKRFFGFVTQATQGLAIYNVRIEEAASLIAELGESLGEAEASNFVQGLTKGFAAQSYTDRFKTVLLAGQGATTKVIEANAEVLAGTFAHRVDALGKESKAGVEAAFKDLGGAGFIKQLADGDAGALKTLMSMGGEDRRALLTAVRGADAATARQLETLIGATEGLSGNLTDQAKALDDLGPGGTLAMQLMSASAVIGAPISDMSGIQLAAFEQMTGIGGEQLRQLQRVDSQLRGNYEYAQKQLQAVQDGKRLSHADAKKMAEEVGLTIETGADGTARVMSASVNEFGEIITGSEIDNIEEYLVKQGDALAKAVETPMTRQEEMTNAIVQNTESILNRMDTTVAWGFEKVADILQSLYDFTAGVNSTEAGFREQLIKEVEGQRELYAEGLAKGEAQLRAIEKQEQNGDITAEEARLQRAEWETYTSDMKAALEETRGSLRDLASAGKGFGMIPTSYTDMRLEAGMDSAQTYVNRLGTGYSMEEYRAMTPEEKAQMEAREAELAQRKKQGGVSVTLQRPTTTMPPVVAGDNSETEDVLEDAVTAPLAEATSDQTTALTKELEDTRKAAPDATAAGVIKATREMEARKAAEILGAGDEQATRTIYEGLLRGKRLSEDYTKTLQTKAPELMSSFGALSMLGTPTATPDGGDFIYRAGANTITKFDSADDIMGAKPGGAIDKSLGGGGGGSTVININGGDTARIYQIVKEAVAASRGGRGPTT